MSKIRLAIIGLGNMGKNHLRVASDIEDFQIISICDNLSKDLEALAKKYSIASCYKDVGKLLENETIDAAIISAPTHTHLDVGFRFLEKGIHTFIEKPMATTVDECGRLLEAAEKHKALLMVGHVERFNPVIVQLKKYIDAKFAGDLYYTETVRSGPFPKRLYGSKDGVVIDLAVHDLDLISFLFGPLKQIYAHHITIDKYTQDIYAKVMFKTKSLILGTSEFSWISPKRNRAISIYGDKGLLTGNLIDQEIWFYENGDVNIDTSDNYYQNVMWGRVSEGKVIKYPIKREEPLKNELKYFIEHILTGTVIDSTYGCDAVHYSRSVLKSAEEDTIIYF